MAVRLSLSHRGGPSGQRRLFREGHRRGRHWSQPPAELPLASDRCLCLDSPSGHCASRAHSRAAWHCSWALCRAVNPLLQPAPSLPRRPAGRHRQALRGHAAASPLGTSSSAYLESSCGLPRLTRKRSASAISCLHPLGAGWGRGRDGRKQEEEEQLQWPKRIDFLIFVFLKKYRLYITRKRHLHSSFFPAGSQKFPGRDG